MPVSITKVLKKVNMAASAIEKMIAIHHSGSRLRCASAAPNPRGGGPSWASGRGASRRPTKVHRIAGAGHHHAEQDRKRVAVTGAAQHTGQQDVALGTPRGQQKETQRCEAQHPSGSRRRNAEDNHVALSLVCSPT